jgi:hypothetical protein
MQSGRPEIPEQEKENLAETAMGSLGVDGGANELGNSDPHHEVDPAKEEDLPLAAKAQIGKMQKRHQRDMRRMEERLQQAEMRAQNAQPNTVMDQQATQSQGIPGQMMGQMNPNDIHQAVNQVLQQREAQERQQHLQKQYQKLNDHLDKGADKYDDFDEVVRGNTPFTPQMRDAALMIDNPADVLYKLGKNPDELERIAKLHPLDQAREITKLSFALMSGKDASSGASPVKTMNPIKSQPVTNTRAVSEKTPISELRQRMRDRTWK